MIPTPRLVWLAAAAVVPLLLGLFESVGLVLGATVNLALVALTLGDRWATPMPGALSVERRVAPRWVQGRSGDVTLVLRWKGRRSVRIRLRDVAPVSFRVARSLFDLRVSSAAAWTLVYPAVPAERGTHTFGPIAVRTRGPLGLIERQAVLSAPATVRVYPDLIALSPREAALVAPSPWLLGKRRGALRGEGREFHQLRDYQSGDDLRWLDWKAFAHRGRPTVREYRSERNQRVLLVLDAGRLMTARIEDRSRLDWAVQAAGRLARVVLAQGDAVGIALFSRRMKALLAPARGPGHLGRLTELLGEAQPDLEEPDLGLALRTALRGGGRRTLVVVFTELADPRAAEMTLRHVGALAPRHLGLVVSLADGDLDRERREFPTDAQAAYRRLAADELWQDYRRAQAALESRGALVVRARANALAAEAIERYVEVKRTGRL